MAKGESALSDMTCTACQGSWPRQDHFIANLGSSKAYLHEDQFFPGWTVVVVQRHATELFQLAPTERAQLIEEVSLVAKILSEVYQAKKINYELLGNQLPHIHWHLVPRLADDPAPREPVWCVPHDPVLLTGSLLQDAINRIAQPLQQGTLESSASTTNSYQVASFWATFSPSSTRGYRFANTSRLILSVFLIHCLSWRD
ncbi:MAG: HIT family protein [Nitrospira sp.]|nr:HIT family protein [Nitrospira sp.]